jgi:uncharacterized protein
VKRYTNFYTDLSALTLPIRLKIQLKPRHHPEIFERLIFGIDYHLSVFHLSLWEVMSIPTIRQVMELTNRLDRQYLVCQGLGLQFGSLNGIVAKSAVPTPSALRKFFHREGTGLPIP